MVRKGYKAELKTKQMLEGIYGKHGVVKIAIAQQGADFIVIRNGAVEKVVEVKETRSEKYYPNRRERKQIARIRAFCRKHGIVGELWVWTKVKGKFKLEVIKLYNGTSIMKNN